MNLNEFKIGTRLELELQSKDEKSSHVYVSQLLEPIMDNRFIIAAPIFEARLIYIPTDAKVRVVFNHYNYGLLGLMSIVRSKEMRGNIAVMHMEVAGAIEKVQRRTYYRLDCLLDTEYKLYEGKKDKVPEELKKAITKNISGSGACIVTNENLSQNTMLEVIIHLDTGSIKTVCMIIRSTEVENNKGKIYHLGVRFTEISPKDRDLIVKYVFYQQRLLLKKETS